MVQLAHRRTDDPRAVPQRQRDYERLARRPNPRGVRHDHRSEEHTSELQSLAYLVCRLLLEKKKKHQKKARDGRQTTIKPDTTRQVPYRRVTYAYLDAHGLGRAPTRRNSVWQVL